MRCEASATARANVNGSGGTAVDGLFYGGGVSLLGKQALAAGSVLVYSFVLAFVIGWVVNRVIGFRLDPETGLRKMQSIVDLYETDSAEESGETRKYLKLAHGQIDALSKQVRKYAEEHLRSPRQSLPAEPHCSPILSVAVWDPFTAWLWRMSNHVDAPPEVLLDPTLAASCVTLVDPKMFDAREVARNSLQQQGHGDTERLHLQRQLRPQRRRLLQRP